LRHRHVLLSRAKIFRELSANNIYFLDGEGVWKPTRTGDVP
jgi:hypothetical protein